MKRLASPLLALTAVTWASAGRAEEPSRPASVAFLWSGDAQRNPGNPGAAKVVTVTSLYALSVTSLAMSAVFGARALSAASDADAYRDAQPRGFCEDPTATACTRYDALKVRQSAGTRDAAIFAGLGSMLFLGGAATAQLWPNDLGTAALRARPMLGRRALGLRITGSF